MPIGTLTAKDERMSSITEGSNVFLNVPRYQRGYAWTRDNVDDLLNDIDDVPSGQFFIGTVILHSLKDETDTYNLIDGQQRMTTCTILLATIRNKLMQLGETENALTIQRHISSKPLGGTERHRLTPCAELLERDFFQKVIQSKKPREQKAVNQSQKHVIQNRKEFENWIELNLEPSTPQFANNLVDLAIRITKSKIILIKVEHAEDAYKIFESVNARGVDLSVADLLKNYLLTNLREDPSGDEAAESWLESQRTIERVGQGVSMPKFVRYSWISRYQFDSEKNMFRGIKNMIGPNDCERFLNILREDATLLERIMTAALDEENSPRYKQVNEVLSNIHLLGVKQYVPFAMGLMRNCDRLKIDKPDKLLSTVEKFLFRYNAICALPSNKVERLFSRVSRDMENFEFSNERELIDGRDRIFNDLRNTLRDLNPLEELFIQKFTQIKYKTSPTQKNLIRRIFSIVNKKIGTGEISFETNIEHILPQKPQTWGLTKQDIAGYVDNIGNLTMIQRQMNSRMGNKPFDEKFPILMSSEIKLNGMLEQHLDEGKWNHYSIEARATELAAIVDFATKNL
tara:strand:+ start:129 stop:1844 length:1716 start_codon:yes stop_codon:yes gene_type:complete